MPRITHYSTSNRGQIAYGTVRGKRLMVPPAIGTLWTVLDRPLHQGQVTLRSSAGHEEQVAWEQLASWLKQEVVRVES